MMKEQNNNFKYSAIIIIEEGYEGFIQVVSTICDIFRSRNDSFEILIIANENEDQIKEELRKIKECSSNMKLIVLGRNASNSVCRNAGIKLSRGEILLFCETYQQITKESFVRLIDSLDSNTDAVCPWRQNRVDSLFNQFQSKVFNYLLQVLTRTKFNDLGCKVKLFRKKIFEDIPVYGNLYRFLPVLVEKNGYKVKEIKCDHFQQIGKTGLRRPSRYLSLIVDCLTLYFNLWFAKKPLRFFGSVGAFFLVLGLVAITYIFLQRILGGQAIGGRPLLLVALISMVIGVQTTTVGLLGEIIAFTHGRSRKGYHVEREI